MTEIYTKKEVAALRANQPYYGIEIRYSDEDKCYIATASALPGCMSDGDTRPEAAENIEIAIADWLDEAESIANTKKAPLPDHEGRTAGRG